MRRAPAPPRTHWTIALSVAALALAGGLLSVVAVDAVLGVGFPDLHPTHASVPTAICTTVLLAFALGLSLLTSSRVVLATMVACGVLGWLNTPASLALFWAIERESTRHLPSLLVFASLIGLATGAPLGLLYGALSSMATRRLRRLIDAPTLTTRLDAQVVVSGLLVLCGALASATWVLTESVQGQGAEVPLLVLAVGLLGLAQSQLRRRRLLAWARDPSRHGLERVALDDLGIVRDGLWRLSPDVPFDTEYVLVRREDAAGDGAYRRAAARVPLALVA